jgi:single-stranded-DNA-specific exonuclease
MASILADAIIQKHRILIIGDYDTDGATSTAVGVRALKMMGADVGYLVPNRFEFVMG